MENWLNFSNSVKRKIQDFSKSVMTRLQCMAIVTCCILLLITGLCIYFLTKNNANAETKCTETIKPCTSFCLYVCNTSMECKISLNTVLGGCGSKTKDVMSPTTREIIDLLEEPNTISTIEPVKMVKKLYKTCTNQEIENNTMEPYWSYIFQERLINIQLFQTHKSILRQYLRITGHLPLFKYSMKSENDRTTITLELNTSYNRQTMQSIMQDIDTIRKVYTKNINYENVWDFFTKILCMNKNSGLRFITLRDVLPDLSLQEIFADILKNTSTSVNEFSFIIHDEAYLRDFFNLINETCINDLQIILLLDVFQDLYAKFPIIRNEFHEKETIITDTLGMVSQRRKDCLTSIHILSEILDWMYIEKRYTKQVNSIIDHLMTATEIVVSEVKWLDKESKDQASVKLKNLRDNIYIGVEHSNLRKEKLIKNYAILNFTDDFVSNIFSLNKMYSYFQNLKIIHDKEKSEYPTDGRPAYIKEIDSIRIPLATLQTSLFTNDENMIANFAGLGMLIGREIFHAFEVGDDYMLNQWMSEYSFKRNKEVKTNFINEYTMRESESGNTNVNEVKAVNDVITDAYGLKIASKAYLKWKSNGTYINENDDKNLHSDIKEFFVAFAQIFCSSEEINPDDRSTFTQNKIRVHKSLQNIKSFADAFQCPPNTHMNPQPRVEL